MSGEIKISPRLYHVLNQLTHFAARLQYPVEYQSAMRYGNEITPSGSHVSCDIQITEKGFIGHYKLQSGHAKPTEGSVDIPIGTVNEFL